MTPVYCPKCEEETKFVIWLLRRFGFHPEMDNQNIIVPSDQEEGAKHIIGTLGDDFDMNKDLTPTMNEYLMGL